jgi:hypothetical protein
MFAVSMPLDFKIGETRSCSINGKPATLTWRDATHLVICDTDVREILALHRDTDAGRLRFHCGDAGREGQQWVTLARVADQIIVTLHGQEEVN